MRYIPSRGASRILCMHPRRTTCAGCAEAGTGVGRVRVGGWRSFCDVLTGLVRSAALASKAPRLAAVVSATVQPEACSAALSFNCRAATSRRQVRQLMVSRIQRSRKRGSRQPANTKYCGPPTEWAILFRQAKNLPAQRRWTRFARRSGPTGLPVTPARRERNSRIMTTYPAGAGRTSPATWTSTSGQSPASTLRDIDGRYFLICEACLRRDIAIERPKRLPARTAARLSSAGEYPSESHRCGLKVTTRTQTTLL